MSHLLDEVIKKIRDWYGRADDDQQGLREDLDEADARNIRLDEENQRLFDENQKLKDENKRLREKIGALRTSASGA